MSTVLFGRCKGCRRWVPRDEMLSFNTDTYSAENVLIKIRQRYCPPCAEAEMARLRARRWDHWVVAMELLAPMPDGSMPTDDVIRERERQRIDQQAEKGAAPDGVDNAVDRQ